MIKEGLDPARPPPEGFPVTTRDRPATIQQVLDVPADGLAAVVGSWAEPAILESGRGFGDAGRWSFYAARPRLVFEATGTRWSINDRAGGIDSGDGDPLGALARLAARFRLADPADEPDPRASRSRAAWSASSALTSRRGWNACRGGRRATRRYPISAWPSTTR